MSRRGALRLTALVSAAAVSVLAVATGALMSLASPARAASLGAVTLSQAQGTVTDTPMFLSATSPACPTGYGENAALRVGRPGGPYSNLARALGGGGFDTAPVTINPNRSFTMALGGTAPGDGEWWVIMECYSLTNGRHVDEFRTSITVCGTVWHAGSQCGTPTTMALTVAPTGSVEVGQEVTLTATVTPATAAGDVTFLRKTPSTTGTFVEIQKVAVTNGSATIKVSSLPVNAANEKHGISAQFAPSDPAFVGSAAVLQEINVRAVGAARPTEATISVTQASPQPVGTPIELSATVTPAEAPGKATFTALPQEPGKSAVVLGEVAVTGGSAKLTTGKDQLTAGSYIFEVSFVPDTPASFVESRAQTTVAFQIGSATDTTTTLAVAPSGPQPQGTGLTLTATVTPATAAGTVKFLDGTTELAAKDLTNGTATLSTSSLTAGSHSLKAVFAPTGTAFNQSESAVSTYQVSAPPAPGGNLTVVDSGGNQLGANPSLARGQQVTVTGRGFAATETVTVALDGTKLTDVTAAAGSGQYAFAVPSDASEGAHQLKLSGAAHAVTFDFTVAPASAPAPTPASSGGGGLLPRGLLPRTGGPLILLGLAGLALVGAGAGTVLVTGRRRPPLRPVVWPDGETAAD